MALDPETRLDFLAPQRQLLSPLNLMYSDAMNTRSIGLLAIVLLAGCDQPDQRAQTVGTTSGPSTSSGKVVAAFSAQCAQAWQVVRSVGKNSEAFDARVPPRSAKWCSDSTTVLSGVSKQLAAVQKGLDNELLVKWGAEAATAVAARKGAVDALCALVEKNPTPALPTREGETKRHKALREAAESVLPKNRDPQHSNWQPAERPLLDKVEKTAMWTALVPPQRCPMK